MPAQPSQKSLVAAAEPLAATRSEGLRADARHNRDRILEAAREAYAAQGIDVPVTAIARRAGVGVATLYRRFPTRAALITEAFAEQFAQCGAVLDEALDDPDPWRGFCTLIEKVCAMQAADRGFTAAFLARFPDAVDIDGERARAEEGIARLVRRAQEAGQLRADFHPGDVTLLLLANCGVAEGSPEVSAAASRRLVGYLLQSFRAGRTAPLPPPAPLELRRVHQSPHGR
ncbi:helix-turn-helix domain-containing protein [Streptomyces sp. ITFR-16]|uniref:TetR/AcrR family transcriptional regulator n=1 Tax=Streptomyces sp. ITFR-16 TaxID=3075198 RepID=UPI00288B5415|nr:helix-turn-helix domain-containing protein [Streptomyces sp. ITFR-16]WNI21943.1 helix-turn-helix domain-containing protein [Streptomyces sp. ITFR-16]